MPFRPKRSVDSTGYFDADRDRFALEDPWIEDQLGDAQWEWENGRQGPIGKRVGATKSVFMFMLHAPAEFTRAYEVMYYFEPVDPLNVDQMPKVMFLSITRV